MADDVKPMTREEAEQHLRQCESMLRGQVDTSNYRWARIVIAAIKRGDVLAEGWRRRVEKCSVRLWGHGIENLYCGDYGHRCARCQQDIAELKALGEWKEDEKDATTR